MKHLYDAYSRNTYIAFVIVFSIGATLRLYGLIDFPFIEDSFYTIRDATKDSFGDGLRPVFFLLQRAILQVLPVSHLSLRLLPLTFGLLGIFVIWMVGNRLFGPTAGLSSAILVAVSPWHIYMSQIGRYWSLVFLEALLLVLLIDKARSKPTATILVLAAIVSVLGILTHPSFVFIVAGAVGGVFVASDKSGLKVRIPTNKWIIGGAATLSLVVLSMSILVWKKISLSFVLSTADFATTLRVVPAAVQWLGPVVFVASSVCTLTLLMRGNRDEIRWWGVCSILVVSAFLAGLLIVGQVREIYAYYLTGLLPLAYLAVGGALQQFQDRGWLTAPMSGFVILLLAVSTGPSIVSNLNDGMRFDYRPAYSHISEYGARDAVFGTPIAAARFYAPHLDFYELTMHKDQLQDALIAEKAIWVIASYRRYGLLNDTNSEIESWLWGHCTLAHATERPRFGYRRYATLLYHCKNQI